MTGEPDLALHRGGIRFFFVVIFVDSSRNEMHLISDNYLYFCDYGFVSIVKSFWKQQNARSRISFVSC